MDGTIAFADERQAFVMSDDEARELYEMRQKAEWDRQSEIEFAIHQVAQNALAEGASIEFVHKITGLDMETIANLNDGV